MEDGVRKVRKGRDGRNAVVGARRNPLARAQDEWCSGPRRRLSDKCDHPVRRVCRRTLRFCRDFSGTMDMGRRVITPTNNELKTCRMEWIDASKRRQEQGIQVSITISLSYYRREQGLPKGGHQPIRRYIRAIQSETQLDCIPSPTHTNPSPPLRREGRSKV